MKILADGKISRLGKSAENNASLEDSPQRTVPLRRRSHSYPEKVASVSFSTGAWGTSENRPHETMAPQQDMVAGNWRWDWKGLLTGFPAKPEPIKRTTLSHRPRKHIGTDYLNLLPRDKYLFVLADQISTTRNISSKKTIILFKRILQLIMLPLCDIKGDNGPDFISKAIKKFLVSYGIE